MGTSVTELDQILIESFLHETKELISELQLHLHESPFSTCVSLVQCTLHILKEPHRLLNLFTTYTSDFIHL